MGWADAGCGRNSGVSRAAPRRARKTGKNRVVEKLRMRLPVMGQFAGDDDVVASQRDKVITGSGALVLVELDPKRRPGERRDP
jgi:hypothetical protein